MLRFVLTLIFLASAAEADQEMVVHITCGASKGSGVIISQTGGVVTAHHVVEGNDSCIARIGSRTADPIGLVPVTRIETLDAHMLQLTELGSYPFATYCTPRSGSEITAWGFTGDRSLPSQTSGIISNTERKNGMIEIDAHISQGRSGGPVFLSGTTSITGIVGGVIFDPIGTVKAYAMVPADALVKAGIQEAENCPAELPIETPADCSAGLADVKSANIPIEIEDQSVELEFNVCKSNVRPDRIEICLIDKSGVDNRKQLRIAGVDLNVSQQNPEICKTIAESGGRGQFRWLILGARHVAYVYIPSDIFAGSRITFIWTSN